MKRRIASWRRGTKRLNKATSEEKEVIMADANGTNSAANSTHSPNLSASQQDYEKRKHDILKTEDTVAWDRKARKEASTTQREAARIIWKIREDERDNLYGNKASEAIPDESTLDMGGQFLTNKSRTENESDLYKIAVALPKGGHLHIHFNAELVPDILIKKADANPNMFIRSTRPLLTDQDFELAEMVFNVLPLSTTEADLFSPYYKPEFRAQGAQPWMKWSNFKTQFKHRRNEKPVDWIMAKMILTENEVYGSTQTTNG
jgi:adenosine deaminase CECR1